MRPFRTLLLACVLCAGLLTACKTGQLEPGGAYAPTNSVGQAVIAPDPAFFRVDAAFDIAFSTTDAIFKFEQDNRLLLWQLSPEIKKGLDSIRPDAAQAVRMYGIARKAYKANPTPAGLTEMETWLAKAQQLSVTAQAVTAAVTKGN